MDIHIGVAARPDDAKHTLSMMRFDKIVKISGMGKHGLALWLMNSDAFELKALLRALQTEHRCGGPFWS
jgi:hypothetical protein